MFSVFSVQGQLMEYGLGLGGSVYWGDMNAPDFGTNLGNTNFALQGVLKFNFNKSFAAKANLLYGKLSGDDNRSFLEWQKQRNLNFTSPIFEFSVLGEWHIFGYNYGEENPLSPYLTAGAGVIYFNPSTTIDGVSHDLQPLGTEGQGMAGFPAKYNRISVSLPFGAGVKFKASDVLNISIDVLSRKTFTDYIDDLSTNYVAFDELAAGNGLLSARLSNRIGEYLGQQEPVVLETGSQRGGANVADYFFTGMVTFTFKLNRELGLFGRGGRGSMDCPKF